MPDKEVIEDLARKIRSMNSQIDNEKNAEKIPVKRIKKYRSSDHVTQHGYDKVALVMQGGGALGSYQAGVIEGLLNAEIEPHWVAGISIGAFNTAIIAGNPPEKRLEALSGFWNTICLPAQFPSFMGNLGDGASLYGESARHWLSMLAATRAVFEGQRGFFVPRQLSYSTLFKGANPAEVSIYDTSALKETLLNFADFDRINNGSMHVSLGAVHIGTGNFVYFNNTDTVLRPEHFMASGALPPSFPAVEIDGEFYWDGGLVSNTPLSEVLGGCQHSNTLVFQVDLWNATGRLPVDFNAIAERIQEIRFSSRTRMVTDVMLNTRKYALALKELLDLVPPDVRKQNAICQRAENFASSGRVNIIHLIYKNKPYEGHYKDYEFSLDTMAEHWSSGLQDFETSIAQPGWLEFPETLDGVISHDIHQMMESSR